MFREVSGLFQQNFNGSKNSAVLEPRIWQFSRTWDFEAKNLTFEAKAKDFKMCPRGQARPRGLHLCWLTLKQLLNFSVLHGLFKVAVFQRKFFNKQDKRRDIGVMQQF